MEFTKKNLIKIMEEINSMEVDEMARRPKKVQAPRKGVIPKVLNGWHPNNPTKPGEEGIPDYWILNPRQIPGAEQLIVPLGCDELSEFMERNKEWLEQLRLEHSLEPQVIACKRSPGEWPVLAAIGHKYKASGKKIKEKQSILRKLNPLLKSSFTSSGVQDLMNTRSFPLVKIDEKNLDRYGEISNEKIDWGTHSFWHYSNSNDFRTAIIQRIKFNNKKAENLPSHNYNDHLARQFNKIYRNWVETKKNQKEYEGKTEKYFLDKFGLENDNLDVSIRLDFRINGDLDMINSTYTWNTFMTLKFGKKLENEFTIQGGLKRDIRLECNKTVNFQLDQPYTEFTSEYTVLDNPSIKQGLIECFSDLINQIQSLSPTHMLVKATASNLDLSENKLYNIIKKVIKEEVLDELHKDEPFVDEFLDEVKEHFEKCPDSDLMKRLNFPSKKRFYQFVFDELDHKEFNEFKKEVKTEMRKIEKENK